MYIDISMDIIPKHSMYGMYGVSSNIYPENNYQNVGK